MDISTIPNLARVNKRFSEYCSESFLWREWAKKKWSAEWKDEITQPKHFPWKAWFMLKTIINTQGFNTKTTNILKAHLLGIV